MSRNRHRSTVVEQYAKLAPEYDSRWSFYVRATTDATMARLPNTNGDILDVGCGSGALLARLLSNCNASNLTGVDASPEMLELARNRLPSEVSLFESWAEELPFGDCSFDIVVSCNMFHFIRHPVAALGEMLRVLRPDGIVVISDWCDDFLTCKLCNLYLHLFDPSHHRMYGESDCRKLLESANARQVSIEKYKISWLWGLMTATARKHTDSTAVDANMALQHAT